MKKILIIGDTKRAPYHPLAPVLPHIESALAGVGALTVLEDDYTPLTEEYLSGFDLVLSYWDVWGNYATAENNAAFLAYVAKGGRLLALHGGTIVRNAPEFAMMLGAKFTHHPAACLLDYTPCADHPIVRDVEPFSLTEEPYMYEWDNFADKEVLLTFGYGAQAHPALWRVKYGWGNIVCFAIGHTPASFTWPVEKLLYRSAMWLLGRL